MSVSLKKPHDQSSQARQFLFGKKKKIKGTLRCRLGWQALGQEVRFSCSLMQVEALYFPHWSVLASLYLRLVVFKRASAEEMSSRNTGTSLHKRKLY